MSSSWLLRLQLQQKTTQSACGKSLSNNSHGGGVKKVPTGEGHEAQSGGMTNKHKQAQQTNQARKQTKQSQTNMKAKAANNNS